ncbi:hypothetical protein VIGAN_10005400 [Vigna angularis var. angularis]|uniref:Uncharacterized protein n=1 Tax=Vigna angularis var. angularis TaxID=157739 RepID=A0A0S3T0N3_PHAAN|nr:hypothetical protein VIGAN_10005400 [Vigna angularis var. angularis]
MNESKDYGGICKIVSPIAASNPAAFVLMKEKKDFKFETNLQPLRLSKWNEKETITFSMSGRKYTYHEFEALANKTFFSRFHCSGGLSSSCVEKEFWHEMMHGEKGTVEYGVNVEGSAFSCDPDDRLGISKWNLKGDPWQQENSVRGTANSQCAASKPKTQVADCIKQCVENKTRMLHWRNNVLPSVKGTNRPEIIYNLRTRKSN